MNTETNSTAPEGCALPPCSVSLANDVARCDGVGFQEDNGWDWREGCETCLRRTAQRPEEVWMIEPPAIIAVECEFLIPPNANMEAPPRKTPNQEQG
jgi:hypothetical protein